MKAKDFIIIGGAIALYYLYQKNKTKKSSTDETKSDEGASQGAPSGIISGGIPITTPKGDTIITGGIKPIKETPKGASATVPSSSIASTTEVAIQQGGVQTAPQPAIVPMPIMTPNDSLTIGGITPIVKPTKDLSIDVLPDDTTRTLTVRTTPTTSLVEL